MQDHIKLCPNPHFFIIFYSQIFLRMNGRREKNLLIQSFANGLMEMEAMMKNLFKRHRILLVAIAIVAIAAIAGAAVILPRMGKGTDNPKAVVQENTIELSKMDLTSSVSATGTIESASTATVSARASGIEVKSVKVEEGAVVKKGDTLVTFDQSDLKEARDEAKENLSDVESQNSSELAAAQRKLKEAQETYQSGKSRMAKSVASAKKAYQAAKKAVSAAKNEADRQKAQESLAQAKTAYEQAKNEQENTDKQNKANVQTAEDSLANTKNNNKRSLREAQKNLESAEESLQACLVTAPMSGTVTAVGVSAGDTYSGGDMFEISDCSDLQVTTSISEYDISSIRKGQRVVILTDATDEEEIEGEITYVAVTTGSNTLSSGNSGGSGSSPSTGSSSASSSGSAGYEVRIKIKDKNDVLRVGMTAKCSIVLEEAADVYAVPYDSVHTNSNGDSVLYVKDTSSGTRKEVVVTKGMESDYYVEVSGDELSDSLEVIIPTDNTSTGKDSSDSDRSGSLDGLISGSGKGGMRGGTGKGDRMYGGGPGM